MQAEAHFSNEPVMRNTVIITTHTYKGAYKGARGGKEAVGSFEGTVLARPGLASLCCQMHLKSSVGG